MKHTYRVRPEKTDTHCGFDYESFYEGFNCKNKTTKVIIEDNDFHFAHLCDEHTERVMALLKDLGER